MRQVTASRARTAATVHGRAVERRQLTVIFCDLIGSTAFFEELDPEEVAELMRSFRLCCASQIEVAGGFVAQFQGDGVIGYFGYTEANESNAERAVRAGLDIVRLVPRLSAPGGKPLQNSRRHRHGSGRRRRSAWRRHPNSYKAPLAKPCIWRRACMGALRGWRVGHQCAESRSTAAAAGGREMPNSLAATSVSVRTPGRSSATAFTRHPRFCT